MSTRGAFGYRVDGKDYVTYNHFDSDPGGLGADIANFVQTINTEKGWGRFKKYAQRVELVSEQTNASRELVERYKRYSDLSVGSGKAQSWYCLLRKIQGVPTLTEIFSGPLGHMIDSQGFLLDSLFCEYAYIINLDTMSLECYVGFQKQPKPSNRYGTNNDRGYYPVALMGNLPLESLTLQKIVDLYKKEEDE